MSRDFDPLSEAQVLAGLTERRGIDPSRLARTDAPRPMAELLDAIDHVAEAATGERSFLHLRPAASAGTIGRADRR